MACTWSGCRTLSAAGPIRAAAAHRTVRAMWPPSAVMANCRKPSVSWRAPWARAWPRLAVDCRPHESRHHRALTDDWVLDRARLESARVDDGRIPLADLRPRRSAAAGAVERPVARPPPYLRLGHFVRHPVSRVRFDGIAGQPRRPLGRRCELAAGIRLALHYDFVFACFSSASRMQGTVSRRWATSEASSSWSRISNNERMCRGLRFSKY